MSAKTIMVQGTTSDAGKTTLVTGLCRIFHRRGVKVAPFKPQNMALNSAVAADGGEIGRAQAVQALACGIEPHSDMNPILLKPNSNTGAQVIVQGKAIANMDARAFHSFKKEAMVSVLASYERLSALYDLILVEGAGSPAEINLRESDIANMGFAEAVDCPVVLVADIDRGGVFAHLYGTFSLLSPSEQARIVGFVINKFRGDISLLQSGIDWLEEKTGVPMLGVLPLLVDWHLDAEDSLSRRADAKNGSGNKADCQKLKVIVPVMPRMSNHTDFDALIANDQVEFSYVTGFDEIPSADLIILPGSKSVLADLSFLLEHGWKSAIQRHLRYGGKVIGICGGFQMLGETVHDPLGIESDGAHAEALGLLKMETTLMAEKKLSNVQGTLNLPGDPTVVGYEIHAGVTTGLALSRPAARIADRLDGAISDDNQILGTYLHGLFDHDSACQTLLSWAGLADAKASNYSLQREKMIDKLADAMERHLRLEILEKNLGLLLTFR